ncbi:OLC1v1029176C1 [Oldenlandia corymbosa var. corymbosa]|uniref:non-specific serine/threonine protein kinase n=1 Tax=Oldenlandia corymbosa var. corymbosa TaxID=529605 RepID=A0AAV1CDD1_OLDCO|nr:OLC1v1029176C1 [Oldenlandia corymbosa var. corymbosa]
MDRTYSALVVMHWVMMITCCMSMKHTDIDTDQSALLALKYHITSDSLQILYKNWSSNAPSSAVCDWVGVQCGSRHRRVTALNISGMGLRGTVPPHLGNLSFLVSLDMRSNYFYGTVPRELSRLPRLRFVRLSYNNFSGSIAPLFGTKLQYLDLSDNDFGGIIPSSISNSSNLEVMFLQLNSFTGNIPKEIGNIQTLTVLDLQGNYLVGSIPSSIFNISMLEVLGLTQNNLTGSLPNDICHHLPNLKEFWFAANQLSGQIPPSVSRCSQLRTLRLSFNNFNGSLPKELGNLEMLETLYVNKNNLQGTIPREIGNLFNLRGFVISGNNISGPIPKEIGNLTMLTALDLGFGLFTGNHISGAIPNTLGALLNLQNLSFANNQLEGSLPESLGNMVSLTSLNLSHNYLSGLIPKSLEAISSLQVFDVSSNYLVGEIPSGGCFRNFTSKSFISNAALCGDPRFEVPPCKISKKHRLYGKKLVSLILILAAIFILVIVALACIFLVYLRKIKVPSPQDVPVVASMERISYYELLHATNQLGESNLLGSGSFGSVYKGILNDGKVVAIKVFNLQLEGSLRHFDAECKVLCNLRHRNLVKVISSCSNQDFKALVLVYMPNGSLETWLYSHHLFLNMSKRLNIMIDVAYALQYLHQEYLTPVIHCDLKPSNILLDENLVGHVSDFGITKFLRMDESSALTKTLATIGYIAPGTLYLEPKPFSFYHLTKPFALVHCFCT